MFSNGIFWAFWPLVLICKAHQPWSNTFSTSTFYNVTFWCGCKKVFPLWRRGIQMFIPKHFCMPAYIFNYCFDSSKKQSTWPRKVFSTTCCIFTKWCRIEEAAACPAGRNNGSCSTAETSYFQWDRLLLSCYPWLLVLSLGAMENKSRPSSQWQSIKYWKMLSSVPFFIRLSILSSLSHSSYDDIFILSYQKTEQEAKDGD